MKPPAVAPNTSNPTDNLDRRVPPSKAGGLPAVGHALRHTLKQSGAVRGAKALLRLNQKGGFDCPSCAWPDPDGERSRAEFCENGAKAAGSETTRRAIGSKFFASHSVSELSEKDDHWLEQQGRLAEPMVLRAGASHYAPIEWEEAFAMLGGSLKALADPNHAVFYTSGRASNEAAFLYQLLARAFGTNNLPDCSNMCHESSGLALKESIGIGKGTVTLEDLREAELILVVGQNPGTNHPRMLSTLQQAKEKGARIISINPLREAGLVAFSHPQRVSQLLGGETALADTFIRIPNNGDQALFQGVAKRLFELEVERGAVIDTDFVRRYTDGYVQYCEHITSTDWTAIENAAGVDVAIIDELAEAFAANQRIVSCWAMGLTQHRNAVATIQELVNLHLLRGALSKRGAGLCPVRGHSNVQGDRTVGICEAMPEWFHRKLDETFGIQTPRSVGLNTVQAIRELQASPDRVFVALGGNFLSASPDTDCTAAALRNCSLTVQISTKLNRSHLVTGREALILPCLGRSDRDVQSSGAQWLSVENSMGIVHSSSGHLPPVSPDLKSEVAIICAIGKATVGNVGMINWDEFAADYGRIRDRIEQVVPGFEDYNRRARQPGGFYLPNPVKEGRFETESRKANFMMHELDVEKPREGRLLLMTIRSHDQFNTTIYGKDDRYRGIRGARRVIFMNTEDMVERGIKAEGLVDVESSFGVQRRVCSGFRAIPYDMPRSVAAMYFPEANVLVPLDHVARRSDTPASKSIPIEVRAHR